MPSTGSLLLCANAIQSHLWQCEPNPISDHLEQINNCAKTTPQQMKSPPPPTVVAVAVFPTTTHKWGQAIIFSTGRHIHYERRGGMNFQRYKLTTINMPSSTTATIPVFLSLLPLHFISSTKITTGSPSHSNDPTSHWELSSSLQPTRDNNRDSSVNIISYAVPLPRHGPISHPHLHKCISAQPPYSHHHR